MAFERLRAGSEERAEAGRIGGLASGNKRKQTKQTKQTQASASPIPVPVPKPVPSFLSPANAGGDERKESDPKERKKGNEETREEGYRQPPRNVEEVLTDDAAKGLSMTREEAQGFFEEWTRRGWKDEKYRRLRNWARMLPGWIKRARSNGIGRSSGIECDPTGRIKVIKNADYGKGVNLVAFLKGGDQDGPANN
jgi:hypothetical protein